jgi:hypothetical protein
MLLTGMVSCKKFLDTKPTDFVQPGAYYQNESQLLKALAGVYNPLIRSSLYGGNIQGLLTVCTDESYYGFSNPAVAAAVVVNSFDYTNANIASYWSACYNGIEYANLLIANIDNGVTINAAAKNAILGEALFLRGYYHFLLVQNFGDVPLKLSPTTNPNDVNIPRIPSSQVYAQILKDMKRAEGLVYPTYANTGNSSSRVTQTVVQGMLARVYLYMGGYPLRDATAYDSVLVYTTKVIGSGIHSLNTEFEINPVNIRAGKGDSLYYPLTNGNPGYVNNPYSQVFLYESKSQYYIKETMWEADFSGIFAGGVNQGGAIGSQASGILNGTDYTVLGRTAPQVNASQFLYTSYGAGDLRRDWNIAPYTYTSVMPTTKSFYAAGTAASGTLLGRTVGKWRREYEPIGAGAANKSAWTTGIKYPLLRFADVLLMQAEAENQVHGATSIALGAVNQVRERAYGIVSGAAPIKKIEITNGGTGYTTAPVVTIAGNGGVWASATATVSGGKVTAITIMNAGIGFTAPPTISFGGPGTGATAAATLFTATDVDLPATLGKGPFQDSLIAERSRELCFESLRKYDLVRWGNYLSKMRDVLSYNNATGMLPTNGNLIRENGMINNTLAGGDKFLLWPIPAAEITVNKAMVQNPSW